MALIDNLVSYYKLQETTGDVVDSEGSNTGTNVGATRGATGLIGNCFDFDGTNDEVTVADNNTLDFGTGDFSVNFWVNAPNTTAADGGLVTKKITSSPWTGFVIRFTTNHKVDYITTGVARTITISTGIADSSWHMITLTRSSNTVQLYLDGSADGSSGTDNENIDNANIMRFGQLQGFGSFMDGLLDEIGIWNKALSTTEITDLYNSGNGLTHPFTVGNSFAFIS